jgi:choline dehydrogenase-like flavoprotein
MDGKIAKWWMPDDVVFVDGIPHTATGKILKTALRDQFEVILAGGTFNSPQLLQLSGVGEPEFLKSKGIPVQHALPGVGENLRDHYAPRVSVRVKNMHTINESSRGLKLAAEIFKWCTRGQEHPWSLADAGLLLLEIR